MIIRNKLRIEFGFKVRFKFRIELGFKLGIRFEIKFDGIETKHGRVYSFRLAIRFMKTLTVDELNQVRNQLRFQVWNQVRNQLIFQVRDQIRFQVWNQVRNQVRDQTWVFTLQIYH